MNLTKPDKGFVASASVHAALLVLALVGFTDARKFSDAQESVPVEMITDAQFSQIVKGEKTAKETKPATKAVKVAEIAETKPEAPVNPVAKEVPLPPPPPKRLPEPVEETKADPPPPLKPLAVVTPPPKPEPPAPTPPVRPPEPAKPAPPPPKAEVKPQPPEKPDAEVIAPTPPPKPAPPKLALPKVPDPPPPVPEKPKSPAKPVLDQVASLLKDTKASSVEKPDAEAAAKPKHVRPVTPAPSAKPFDPNAINNLLHANASVSKASTAREPVQNVALGAPNARAPKMSPTKVAAFEQALKDHFYPCWDKGAIQGGGNYVANIDVVFRQNGTLAAQPVLANPASDARSRAIAESAMRAVRNCPPLPIPPDLLPFYNEWKEYTLLMNPNES